MVELVPFSHKGFLTASKTPDEGLDFLGTRGHILLNQEKRKMVLVLSMRGHIFPDQEKRWICP